MSEPRLDTASNRKATKYTTRELTRRVIWMIIGKPLFRWSPRLLFGWRRWILRMFGATVGTGVNIYSSATIYFPWNLEIGDWSSIGEDAMIYNLGVITIGEQVTVSQRAHLCAGTHDHTDPAMPLLKPPIAVRNQAWICADAFVGPSVIVGEGAIIGARAVAMRDVPEWTIVGGNPARPIKPREITE